MIDLPLPDGYDVKFLGGWNNGVLFASNGLDGSALWYSDGTAAGTYILHNPSPETNQFNNEIDFIGFAELDIENLGPRRIDGTDEADNIVGAILRDIIYGQGGNDTLIGLGGDDQLFGGEGRDLLEGGAGADALNGGSGGDTADYSNSDGRVNISLLSGYASGGHAAGDTFDSIENLIGTRFDDRLVGNNGNNALQGMAGADVLMGNGGEDTASYLLSDAAVNISLASGYVA